MKMLINFIGRMDLEPSGGYTRKSNASLGGTGSLADILLPAWWWWWSCPACTTFLQRTGQVIAVAAQPSHAGKPLCWGLLFNVLCARALPDRSKLLSRGLRAREGELVEMEERG